MSSKQYYIPVVAQVGDDGQVNFWFYDEAEAGSSEGHIFDEHAEEWSDRGVGDEEQKAYQVLSQRLAETTTGGEQNG